VLAEVCLAREADLRTAGRDWRWWAEEAAQERPALGVAGWFAAYRSLRPALLGRHQLLNAATAVAAVEALREKGIAIEREAVRVGLRDARWPGRLEVVSERPTVVVDGAHNDSSARCLRQALSEFFSYRRLILVLAVSADKDIAAIAREIAPAADLVIATRSRHPRSALAETVLAHCQPHAPRATTMPDVASALALGRKEAASDDLICVTGSLFAVAEAREVYGLTDFV
jgi:dihydrofolate synthase / folylpolyglutamate synthase